MALNFYLHSDNYTIETAKNNLRRINEISIDERIGIAVSLRKINSFKKISNRDLLVSYDPWYYYVSAIDNLNEYQSKCFDNPESQYCSGLKNQHDKNINAAMKNSDFIRKSGEEYYDELISEYRKRPPATDAGPTSTSKIIVVPQALLYYAPISGWTFIGKPRFREQGDPVVR